MRGGIITAIGHALSSFHADGETFDYLSLKSAVIGVPVDEVEDSAYDDVDATILSYLSQLGLTDQQIDEMVGNLKYSEQIMAGVAAEYAMFTEADIDLHATTFDGFTVEDVTLDGISPPQCKTGYKRKLTVKGGKPQWKCIRLLGRHIKQSAKQKAALRKARRSAHTGAAKYHRARSLKVGKQRGMY